MELVEITSETVSKAESSLAEFAKAETERLLKQIKGEKAVEVIEMSESLDGDKRNSAKFIENQMRTRKNAARIAGVAGEWLSGKNRIPVTELTSYMWIKDHHDAAETTVHTYQLEGNRASITNAKKTNPDYTPTASGLNEIQAEIMVKETSIVLRQMRERFPLGTRLLDSIDDQFPNVMAGTRTANVDISTKAPIRRALGS